MKNPFIRPEKKPAGRLSSALFRAAETVSGHEEKVSQIRKNLKDPGLRKKKRKKKVPGVLRFSFRTARTIYHHQYKINKALLAVGNVVEYQVTKFR